MEKAWKLAHWHIWTWLASPIGKVMETIECMDSFSGEQLQILFLCCFEQFFSQCVVFTGFEALSSILVLCTLTLTAYVHFRWVLCAT